MARPNDLWFDDLFDDAGLRLLRLAARLNDGTEANDLAQEAYLRLLRVDNALLIRSPRSYALRVAANVAYEWGRLARYQKVHVGAEHLDAHESESPTPLEQAVLSQQADAVRRALDRLSTVRRAIILLHIRDGLTYPQIAAQLGLSVSMTKKHLALGLEACRQFLARERGGRKQ